MNTYEFIEKSKSIHGNKYDYSKVKYINPKTKVCIICPEHGEFWQLPYGHLQGKGCTKCGRNMVSAKFRKKEEDFIASVKEIFGDKYDYSKVSYINSKTKVCIVCPEHGEFWQTPSKLLVGAGCSKCGNKRKGLKNKKSVEEVIDGFKNCHGNKYDYSKVEYKSQNEKICIICPEHGEFWQTPRNHLKGEGCPKCNGGTKMTKADFVEKAKKVHGDKYDYSKVEYVNASTKVCIICPEHGEFWQTPNSHLKGRGCPRCSKFVFDTNTFLQKSIELNGTEKYDYSKVKYVSSHKKVLIKCKKCGNEFWQTPNDHLNGRGCPFCKKWKLEEKIHDFLTTKGINFIRQCGKETFKWLSPYRLDFFLPEYNIAIECQGKQHFEAVNAFGGEEEFLKTKNRDIEKLKRCKENGIKILYFTKCNVNEFHSEKTYKTEKDILEAIKNEKRLL